MGLINLKYRNTSVSLVAEDELRTCELARRFNARIDSLAANNNSNVGDAKLAFIIGLMLEDEIDKLNTRYR
jgi:cell division protein ZapA (FtsZ GTPase activity inhibitor)